jgi:intraflagellar transport protein 140
MCLERRVTITEAMAEAMTPPKPEAAAGAEDEAAPAPSAAATAAATAARSALLCKLAQACKKQGSYHLATKKFTQAGDRVRALKVSGVGQPPAAPAAASALTLNLARSPPALPRALPFLPLSTRPRPRAAPRRAAQALLHTGEAETVIFFAGVSRSREVYVLAANWLQSLAWHADAKLLKAIVDFYTKAKAFERECREC